jgi:hypothetical protein
MTLFYLRLILPRTMESLRMNAMDQWPEFGNQLIILGFSAVISFGILVLLFILGQMKYHTHKKLLEIEYKICELLEK